MTDYTNNQDDAELEFDDSSDQDSDIDNDLDDEASDQFKDYKIQRYETDELHSTFAYDANQNPVGDTTASVEHRMNENYVCLHNINVEPEYRRQGLGTYLLDGVETFAHRNNVTQIYGTISSEEARSFWQHQSKYGWQIDDDGIHVRKHLR